MSGASERANGRASSPILTSVFFSIFDHSAPLSLFIHADTNILQNDQISSLTFFDQVDDRCHEGIDVNTLRMFDERAYERCSLKTALLENLLQTGIVGANKHTQTRQENFHVTQLLRNLTAKWKETEVRV